MNKDLSNIFNEMSKDDLMNFFKECGLEVEDVEPGQGGFYVDGKNIDINNYNSVAKISNIQKYATNNEKVCGSSWNAINYINNGLCNASFNYSSYINRLLQDQDKIINSKLKESDYSNIDNKYDEDFSKAA